MYKLLGESQNVDEIDVTKVASILGIGSVIVIDVRQPDEYDSGHIPGSILAPLDSLELSIENITPHKSAKIYVYCRSGVRSVRATSLLISLGYTNVKNIRGGMLAWLANELPIE